MLNIDTSGFVLKNKYDTYKSELERTISDTDKKNPDASELIKKLDYNAKIKIPSITGLAATSALTAVENKVPNVSNLVKKQIITQQLVKLKRKLLIMIMINISLLQNSTS